LPIHQREDQNNYNGHSAVLRWDTSLGKTYTFGASAAVFRRDILRLK